VGSKAEAMSLRKDFQLGKKRKRVVLEDWWNAWKRKQSTLGLRWVSVIASAPVPGGCGWLKTPSQEWVSGSSKRKSHSGLLANLIVSKDPRCRKARRAWSPDSLSEILSP